MKLKGVRKINNEVYVEEFENICSRKVENRFSKKIILKNHFRDSFKALDRANSVVLVTGFCIKSVMVGETDGPIGTVVMAKALEKLGKNVTIITDKYSSEFIKNGLDHYNLKSKKITLNIDFSEEDSQKIISDINPDIIFFIERPSKNRDGDFNSMSGESITGIIPDTDFLFNSAREQNKLIIALGDGGNEVGMNLIKDEVVENVKFGSKICSITNSDYLIVSGVSNWGCYSLVGALSVLNNQDLLPSVNDEEKHLKKIVASGAVDGVSKKTELSVDGYTLNENMNILYEVRRVIEDSI